jgi:polysaccharide biosynthesis/export protein
VIFSISFRDPGGYFLATNFQMRNQDVLFVANSPSVDVTKYLNYLNTMIATGNNVILTGTNGIILYNSIRALNGTGTAATFSTATSP